MEEKKRPERHSAFFDLERDPQRAELTRPRSLLKSTEWGGLTLLSLLVSWAFPPYFVSVMALAFLHAGGMLWVTHLSEVGRQRLREFEREFAVGHALEQAGRVAEAIASYKTLIPRYQDQPKIAEIAIRRIEHLRREHPKAVKTAKAPRRGRAKPRRQP